MYHNFTSRFPPQILPNRNLRLTYKLNNPQFWTNALSFSGNRFEQGWVNFSTKLRSKGAIAGRIQYLPNNTNSDLHFSQVETLLFGNVWSYFRPNKTGNPQLKTKNFYILYEYYVFGQKCFSCVGTIRSIVSLQWWFKSGYISGARPHTCGVS
jgi:hypothetical protein